MFKRIFIRLRLNNFKFKSYNASKLLFRKKQNLGYVALYIFKIIKAKVYILLILFSVIILFNWPSLSFATQEEVIDPNTGRMEDGGEYLWDEVYSYTHFDEDIARERAKKLWGNYCKYKNGTKNNASLWKAEFLEAAKKGEFNIEEKEHYDVDEEYYDKYAADREIDMSERTLSYYLFPSDKPVVFLVESSGSFHIQCTNSDNKFYFQLGKEKDEAIEFFIYFDPRTNKFTFYHHTEDNGISIDISNHYYADKEEATAISGSYVENDIIDLDMYAGNEIKMQMASDIKATITILESNFEAKIPDFSHDVELDDYSHWARFKDLEIIKPNRKNVVISPEVPRMTKEPKLVISYDEVQKDGSTKKKEDVITGRNEGEPEATITYISLYKVNTTEAFGVGRAFWEPYGDAQFIPSDLQTKIYVDDRMIDTPNWEEESFKFFLNGFSKGEHTVKLENLVDNEVVFTTYRSFNLDLDHNNKLYFPDVPKSAYYYDSLAALVRDGIIQGYPDGTFGPDKTIRRAELLKIAMMAGNKTSDNETFKTYSDVKSTDWFYSHVQAASKAKIVKGYDDGTFQPGKNINRVEALKVILLALDQKIPETCITSTRFMDIKNSQWFQKYVCHAESINLLDRLGNKFEGEKEITRAEVVDWVGKISP